MRYIRWFGIALLLVMSTQFAGANLLRNPGFEEPPVNWTFSGNAGVESWAARAGYTGAVFQGWVFLGAGSMAQEVSVTSSGTYTFAIWVKREANFPMTSSSLKLEWLDGSGASVAPAVTNTAIAATINDSLWRQFYVTGSCSAPGFSKIRATISAAWDVAMSDPRSFMVDDAELYEGPFITRVANNSFEIWSDTWETFQWKAYVDNAAWDETWGNRSGLRGIAFHGWDESGPVTNRGLGIMQNLNITTSGTYTLSAWFMRETNFLHTNTQLRIEWYLGDYTSKGQADTITNFVVPNDENWHEYYVTGILTNPLVREARVTITNNWALNYTNSVDRKAMRMDDIRFVTGSYTDLTVTTDWHYFNGGAMSPMVERVPGTNVGTFVQVNYATTSTTFYVLTESSDFAIYPQEDGEAGIKVTYRNPTNETQYPDLITNMVYQGPVTLTAANPFHGLPTVGTKTLSLWKFVWNHPLDAGTGQPFTNGYPVYYSPFVRSMQGIVQSGIRYFAARNGAITNNYLSDAQQFDASFMEKDYSYWNFKPQLTSALTNGGFEFPTNNTFDGSGWAASGLIGHDQWAAHSGNWGAAFQAWNAGEGEVYQYIASTGGVYTFATWLRQEQGVDPISVQLRLDWYDSAYQLVKSDVKSLATHPRDAIWHHTYVTGTCLSNGVTYVKPSVFARFNAGTGTYDKAIMVDDAALYAGAYQGITELANGSLEEGISEGWRGSSWSSVPERAGGNQGACRKVWANRSGGWGFGALSYTNEGATPGDYETTLTQCLTPGADTYTFSVYMLQELNSLMTNVVLKLESYDEDYNLLDTAVRTLTTPLTQGWTRYDLTGNMTDPDTFEVRASILLQWQVTATDAAEKAFKLDDFRLVRASSYPTNMLDLNWNYYSGMTTNPAVELVPGSGVGTFLQVNYASTTTTFYVLANTNIATFPGEAGRVGMKIYFSTTNQTQEFFTNCTRVGTVTITDSAPFHGKPVSGSQVLDLWKLDWKHPLFPSGTPDTNRIFVFYAPYLESTYGIIHTDQRFFAGRGSPEYTNDFNPPQWFSYWYDSKDYLYVHQRTGGGDEPVTEGIPDSWWQRYSIPVEERHAAGDPDTDDHNNMEEYIADTSPIDEASFYDSHVSNMTGRITLVLMAGPPTTNSRRYEVYWKTNLMDQSWTAYGLNVPGADNGGVVLLTVTNDPGRRFYRTGVKLP
jgi:hypothetical protein